MIVDKKLKLNDKNGIIYGKNVVRVLRYSKQNVGEKHEYRYLAVLCNYDCNPCNVDSEYRKTWQGG